MKTAAVLTAALLLCGAAVMSDRLSAKAAGEMEDSRKIAITFDDGPHPYYTEQLLDGLKERGVKATFFVTGMHAEQYPELICRMSDEGHLIGNHTYSHIQLSSSNSETFKEELIQTNEVIEELTGQEVQYVRPPYGTWDKKFNVARIVQKVMSKADENDIILMHDEYKSTVTAALQIIDELMEQGYEFVTVDELLFD